MEKVKFNIGEIKQNARLCSQRYYWRSVGAFTILTLLAVAASYLCMIPLLGSMFAYTNATEGIETSFSYSGAASEEQFGAAAALVGVMVLVYVVLFALVFFFVSPLQFGYYRLLTSSREVDTPVSTIFHMFKHGYLHSVGYSALMTLKIFGWALLSELVLVPGGICLAISEANNNDTLGAVGIVLMVIGYILMLVIILRKTYQYEMGAFALAENPGLTVGRSFDIGISITKGYIFKLFLLDLSYILWYLLAAITAGVGVFFITPVPMAGKAEAYTFLKSVAAANGSVPRCELPGYTPEPETAPAMSFDCPSKTDPIEAPAENASLPEASSDSDTVE